MGDFPSKERGPVSWLPGGSRLCPLLQLAADWEVAEPLMESFVESGFRYFKIQQHVELAILHLFYFNLIAQLIDQIHVWAK